MISIIICSRQPDIADELKKNIATTIGCDYELVVIDNSHNHYSIFSAYNEGVRRAKGDILCFMHEDILFRSNDWGRIGGVYLVDNQQVMLIGVAGCHFLSSYPFYWAELPIISEHNLHNDCGKIIECKQEAYYGENGLVDVVAVDGMFFIAKRQIFNFISFDEKTFTGFHAYDMDICMQVIAQGYRVCVTNRILLEHKWSETLSKGKKGYDQLRPNMELFVKKWQNVLPLVKGVDFLPPSEIVRLNRIVGCAYDAIIARRSKSYKIGRMVVRPIILIKNFIRKILYP